mmetsp:Transcript_35188/g.109560  ORF Transcript_35188/g.109560 Transcript_35188/m.109560 type:complete len:112 (+) Transcript_35188:876-1211(+)
MLQKAACCSTVSALHGGASPEWRLRSIFTRSATKSAKERGGPVKRALFTAARLFRPEGVIVWEDPLVLFRLVLRHCTGWMFMYFVLMLGVFVASLADLRSEVAAGRRGSAA